MNKGRAVDIPATDKQRLAWQAWMDNSIDDVVYGGRAGGGKSMLGCQVLTGYALKYPETKYYLGREELKNIMLSTYVTLTQKVFPQYGLTDKDWSLDGKYNVIRFKNGSTINLLDLKLLPTDPMFDRFGSHEYTCGWIEEASEVDFKAYDVLKSRVGRWKNTDYGIIGKTLLTLNPSQDWPYRLFYAPWKESGRSSDIHKPLISLKSFDADGKPVERKFVFIEAAYKDNPFTAKDYARQLATISDPVLKARLMEGDWEFHTAKDTLFTADTIASLFKNTVKWSEDLYLIVDAARLGGDEIVLNVFRGWNSFHIERYTMLRTTETAVKIQTLLDRYGIPEEHLLIDEDGVGGGVLDHFPGALGFHGGASPFGKIGEQETKENYENLRAQCVYYLSSMAQAHKVSVTVQDIDTEERIAQDLKQFKRRDADKDGKLKVAKKEDMKKALGRSPDCGDTFMMRSYFDLRVRDEEIARADGGSISVYIPEY